MAKGIQETNPGLSAALEKLRARDGNLRLQPQVVRHIPSASNETWLVAAGTAEFVVRLNRDQTRLGVDRAAEASILSSIRGASFAPTVVYLDDLCLVTEFVPGTPPLPPQQYVARIGELFRDIHNTPTTVAITVDPMVRARQYVGLIGADNPLLHRCAQFVFAQPAPTPVFDRLCHHDLTPANLIITPDHIVALDWEYAGIGDPAFDLAVFAETSGLDEVQRAALLNAYLPNPSTDALASWRERLDYYGLLYNLIDVLWWTIHAPTDESNTARVAELVRRTRGQSKIYNLSR